MPGVHGVREVVVGPLLDHLVGAAAPATVCCRVTVGRALRGERHRTSERLSRPRHTSTARSNRPSTTRSRRRDPAPVSHPYLVEQPTPRIAVVARRRAGRRGPRRLPTLSARRSGPSGGGCSAPVITVPATFDPLGLRVQHHALEHHEAQLVRAETRDPLTRSVKILDRDAPQVFPSPIRRFQLIGEVFAHRSLAPRRAARRSRPIAASRRGEPGLNASYSLNLRGGGMALPALGGTGERHRCACSAASRGSGAKCSVALASGVQASGAMGAGRSRGAAPLDRRSSIRPPLKGRANAADHSRTGSWRATPVARPTPARVGPPHHAATLIGPLVPASMRGQGRHE
jgi:hypothetical protein